MCQLCARNGWHYYPVALATIMKGLHTVGVACVLLSILLFSLIGLEGKIFQLTQPGQVKHGVMLGQYWTSPISRFEQLVAGVLLVFGVFFLVKVARYRRETGEE